MRNYTVSKGFSLIELMVVVGIIGILAAVAVPNYQTYMLKTRVAEMISLNQQLMQITSENFTLYDSCYNTPAGDGEERLATTPEYAQNATTATIQYYSRLQRGPSGEFCVVAASGNPAIFGGTAYWDFLYAFNRNATNPNGSTVVNKIQWRCYYDFRGNTVAQRKVLPLLPAGCVPRAGF